ncbi:hypothetical protein L6164_026904 [Bauhinia variegata]|uniref:Uncharacterized protein n=1 Tax=Bauhinia variegata TaxID=167791 RepID=A0ACB9LRM0_BAUVA|nr:hypothetical protein L6164_026904 [Bauhinia variegata]
MAAQCNFLRPRKPFQTRNPLFSSTHFISSLGSSVYPSSSALSLKSSTSRWGRIVSAVVSEEKAIGSSFSAAEVFKLTYLEGNSWLWNVSGITYWLIQFWLVTWILEFPGYMMQLRNLMIFLKLIVYNITEGLDDHCHLKTLKPLSEKAPNLKVIATPNTKE